MKIFYKEKTSWTVYSGSTARTVDFFAIPPAGPHLAYRTESRFGYADPMTRKAPTVKQHLACIRMLFDWLVTGQVIASNPAHAVRGPRHSVMKGAITVMSS